MESKAVSVLPGGGEGLVQFDIIVFHRDSDVTVVAILPRAGSPSGSAFASNTTFRTAPQFRRLIAAFLSGILYRMPGNEMREFWEQAMETQISSRPTPASQKSIEELPTNDVESLERISGDKCTICQEAYKIGDKMITLPCHHSFHKDCLIPWLKQRNTCPNCRYKLPIEEKEIADQEPMIGDQKHLTWSSSTVEAKQAEEESKGRRAIVFHGSVPSPPRPNQGQIRQSSILRRSASRRPVRTQDRYNDQPRCCSIS
ncbi:hypothetical protein AAMO2058_000841000 [Amorphochlora amoebiformis]|uniref:RING-type E3 ubiquitin transferase n=2 Tax=Amorphochlora amoebiformis TaxID=1561963 RepID=A0A7S0DNY4_9EUKA|mmetsp:Transcript_4219/g.6409  ORF Transcript_4219/g.6409 Transcript_4219/m.6409 type:complete len:257 (+) Transcript_4219:1-771(+)|eukprot:1343989-Amorphochlora_amoeboformis.AAC.2